MTTLDSLKNRKVAVLGDIMIDEYLNGYVGRISPEAPVPVHLVKDSRLVAGGAANAARNISMLGGDAFLFSVVGRDSDGKSLSQLLREDGVNVDGVLVCESRPTIKKTRVTSSNHQLIRIDWENPANISHETEEQVLALLKKNRYDSVLISDYGKGFLTDSLLKGVIKWANDNEIPVIVDPKGKDFSKYSGASLITPNRKEACEALGFEVESDVSGLDLATRLLEAYDINEVLVTLSSEGMVYLDRESNQVSEKPAAKEVFDVSGAGDSVAAIFALSAGSRLGVRERVHLATVTAGIVVGKWGTQPALVTEVNDFLKSDNLNEGNYLGGFWVTNEDVLFTLNQSDCPLMFNKTLFFIEKTDVSLGWNINTTALGARYIWLSRSQENEVKNEFGIKMLGNLN